MNIDECKEFAGWSSLVHPEILDEFMATKKKEGREKVRDGWPSITEEIKPTEPAGIAKELKHLY